jgi:hypothetical protein
VAEFHAKRGRQYAYHRCARSKPRVVCREKPISESMLVNQLSDYFRRLAIPEPILAFLRDRLDRLDFKAAGATAMVREQRDKALKGLDREERELLGMRMRQLVSDEEFHREREVLSGRRRDLEEATVAPATANDAREERALDFRRKLDLTQGGPLMFAEGTPVQVRSLLQQLHLEIVLRGRRLDFTVQEPLSQLVKAGSDSSWCATWFEIWKWIQFGEPAESLHISEEELRRMMGKERDSV